MYDRDGEMGCRMTKYNELLVSCAASRLSFSDDDDEWVDKYVVDDLAALFMVMMTKQ